MRDTFTNSCVTPKLYFPWRFQITIDPFWKRTATLRSFTVQTNQLKTKQWHSSRRMRITWLVTCQVTWPLVRLRQIITCQCTDWTWFPRLRHQVLICRAWTSIDYSTCTACSGCTTLDLISTTVCTNNECRQKTNIRPMHIDYIRGILFIYLIYFERNMIFLVIFLTICWFLCFLCLVFLTIICWFWLNEIAFYYCFHTTSYSFFKFYNSSRTQKEWLPWSQILTHMILIKLG